MSISASTAEPHLSKSRGRRIADGAAKTVEILMPGAVGIMAVSVFYANATGFTVPEVTFARGERRIVVQAMLHVAESRFYDDVRDKIADIVARGGTYAYEYLRPDSEDGLLATIEDLPPEDRQWATTTYLRKGGDLRAQVAKQQIRLAKLVTQPQLDYIALAGERGVKIDVSLERHVRNLASYGAPKGAAMDDEALERELAALSEIDADGWSATLDRWMDRTALRFKSWFDSSPWTHSLAYGEGHPVVARRDAQAVAMLKDRIEPLIYVTYGAAHLPGITARLVDEEWEIAGERRLHIW